MILVGDIHDFNCAQFLPVSSTKTCRPDKLRSCKHYANKTHMFLGWTTTVFSTTLKCWSFLDATPLPAFSMRLWCYQSTITVFSTRKFQPWKVSISNDHLIRTLFDSISNFHWKTSLLRSKTCKLNYPPSNHKLLNLIPHSIQKKLYEDFCKHTCWQKRNTNVKSSWIDPNMIRQVFKHTHKQKAWRQTAHGRYNDSMVRATPPWGKDTMEKILPMMLHCQSN